MKPLEKSNLGQLRKPSYFVPGEVPSRVPPETIPQRKQVSIKNQAATPDRALVIQLELLQSHLRRARTPAEIKQLLDKIKELQAELAKSSPDSKP